MRIITEQNPFRKFLPAQLVQNEITRAARDIEILLVFQRFVSVEKCVSDQPGPHNRWRSLGNISAARLVIEMVPPGISAKLRTTIFLQPLQTKFGFFQMSFVPVRLI